MIMRSSLALRLPLLLVAIGFMGCHSDDKVDGDLSSPADLGDVADQATSQPKPPAPPVVTARGLDGAVRLSWADVPGATSYDIARGTTAGGETMLMTVTAAGFLDDQVTAETPYFYTVTARGDAGAGDPSAEVSAAAFSLDTWHLRNSESIFRAVASGGGVTVVAGDGLRLLSSSDGTSWTARQVPGAGNIYGLAYGAGLFVAVGTNGQIWTSLDGATWTARTSGDTNTLNGVAFGGKTTTHFVAVGGGSTVLTSADGITWTKPSNNLHHTSGSTFDYKLLAVGYGDPNTFNYFVISGSDDNGNNGYAFYMAGDADGTTWAPSPAGGAGFLSTSRIGAIGFGKFQISATAVPSMHLGGSAGFWGHAEESSPGTLTFSTIQAGIASDQWNAIAFDGTSTLRFFGGRIATCSISGACLNGANGFTFETTPRSEYLQAAIYTGGAFITVGPDEVIWREPAGQASNYTEAHLSSGSFNFNILQNLDGIGANLVVAGGTGQYLYSSDGGDTFSILDAPVAGWLANVRTLGGKIYVVGSNSLVMSSSDGSAGSWTVATTTPATANLYDIATSGSLWLTAGFMGAAFTSPDGATWTAAPDTGHSIYALGWDGQVFVASTDDAHILTTTDGQSWTDAFTDMTPNVKLGNLAIHDGTVVVCGSLGHVWVSTDHGASWDPHHIMNGADCTGITYGAEQFLMVGQDALSRPHVYSSADGLTWTERTPTSYPIFGASAAAGRLFTVGYWGSIFSTY